MAGGWARAVERVEVAGMAAVAAEVKAVMAVAWEVMAGMAAVRAGTAAVPAVVDLERAAAGAASVAVVQEKAAPAVAQPQRTASRGPLPASLASRRAAPSEPCRVRPEAYETLLQTLRAASGGDRGSGRNLVARKLQPQAWRIHCCGSAVLSEARVRCIRSKWPRV